MQTTTVAVLNDRPELTLVTDSQDVEAVREHIGTDEAYEFDSFLVAVDDGDYAEVWGMEGVFPAFEKTAYRLV